MTNERVVTPVIQVRLEQMWEENKKQQKSGETPNIQSEGIQFHASSSRQHNTLTSNHSVNVQTHSNN